MKKSRDIPKGAEGFGCIVEPDPDAVFKLGGLKKWQQKIKREMEGEGITITHIDATYFTGYYFSDKITPRQWLHPEDKHPRR